MQNVRLLSILVLAAIFSTGCGDDDVDPKFGDVEIVFQGEWDGQPLVMFDQFEYDYGQNIQFSKSDFYLTNVKLTSSGGDVDLLDVDLVDLSFSSAAGARDGYTLEFKEVEAKTYDGIEFTMGLDPQMNSGRPADYPSSSPLSLPRYWEPWTSYIFAKYEGKLDTLGNGSFDLGWAYHTGTDGFARYLSANADIDVKSDDVLRISVKIDHKKLFGVGDGAIDIKGNPQNHNPKDTVALMRIVDNYATSMTFEMQ